MRFCPREQEMIKATRTRALTEELGDHARGCDACAEIVRISGWMQRFAAILDVPKLPSAREIWSRAEFLAAQSPVARSLRRLYVVSWVALAVVPAVLIYFAWPGVQAWFTGLESGSVAFPSMLASTWSLVWMAAGIIGVATLLTAQMIFAEE